MFNIFMLRFKRKWLIIIKSLYSKDLRYLTNFLREQHQSKEYSYASHSYVNTLFLCLIPNFKRINNYFLLCHNIKGKFCFRNYFFETSGLE